MDASRESAAPEASEAAVTEIRKYCTACWRNARIPAHEWEDLTQQVFVRLLERVPQARWCDVFDENTETDSPRKEFLRGIDTVRKRCQRSRRFVELDQSHPDGRTEVVRRQNEEVDAILTAAQSISAKLRDVIVLILSGERYTHPEMAAILGRSVDQVSDHKFKAIRRLRLLLMQVQV